MATNILVGLNLNLSPTLSSYEETFSREYKTPRMVDPFNRNQLSG